MLVPYLTFLFLAHFARSGLSILFSPILPSSIPQLAASNVSKPPPTWLYVRVLQETEIHADNITRNTTFIIPNSQITLVLTLSHRRIPALRITEVIHKVDASVTREVERSQGSRPAKMPYRAVVEEGVELQFYNAGQPASGMTWSQLKITVYGLWIFMIGGEHLFACHFDIFFAQTQHIFIHIGWGNLVQVMEPDPPSNASRATINYQPKPLSALPSVNISGSDLLYLGMQNSSLD